MKLGIPGLFYGLALGQIVINLMFIRVVYNIDWEAQAAIVKQRETLNKSKHEESIIMSLDESYDKLLIEPDTKTLKS